MNKNQVKLAGTYGLGWLLGRLVYPSGDSPVTRITEGVIGAIVITVVVLVVAALVGQLRNNKA